jgi:hypothetical protein
MTKIKVGSLVKIISNCAIPMDTKTKVLKIRPDDNTSFTTEYNTSVWISLNEVKILPYTKINLQELSRDINIKISELSKENDLIEDKITYLEETKLEEFDETEYKVYQILKLLNVSNITDIEKAKLIADMIKN